MSHNVSNAAVELCSTAVATQIRAMPPQIGLGNLDQFLNHPLYSVVFALAFRLGLMYGQQAPPAPDDDADADASTVEVTPPPDDSASSTSSR